jgi:hypothetical protein
VIRQLSTAAEDCDAGATTVPVLGPPERVGLEEGAEPDEENGFFNKDFGVSAAPTLLMQNMQHTKVITSIAAKYREPLCVVIMINLLKRRVLD